MQTAIGILYVGCARQERSSHVPPVTTLWQACC